MQHIDALARIDRLSIIIQNFPISPENLTKSLEIARFITKILHKSLGALLVKKIEIEQ